VDDCQCGYITKIEKKKIKNLCMGERVEQQQQFLVFGPSLTLWLPKKKRKKMKIFVINNKFENFILEMAKISKFSKPQNCKKRKRKKKHLVRSN
jgi:hypothetical protein